MDLRQLSTFRAAARAGSFAQAALELSYAPSTVTEQVRGLEASLGVALFERHGRGIALTPEGERLLPYADGLADLAEQARAAVAGGEQAAGTVVVGGLETVCAFRLPGVLAAVRRDAPALQVHVQSATRPELEHRLAAGTVDVALTLGEPLGAPDLVSEAVRPEPLALVVPADHRLAGAAEVDDDDLAGETFLVTQSGCSFRALVDRAFAGRERRPRYTGQLPSVGALERCVLQGLGVALLPEVAVAGSLAAGELVALPWAATQTPPSLVVSWHGGRRDTPARRTLLHHLRAELALAAV